MTTHEMHDTTGAWHYRDGAGVTEATSLVGYDVEAADGHIGEVTEESTKVGAGHIVVDTGFWIFDKLRMIPAGAVVRVDHDNARVHLDMTTEEVKGAPDYVEEANLETAEAYDAHRADLERYYFRWF